MWTVYKMYDRDNVLLYCGCTSDFKQRMYVHRANYKSGRKPWFAEVVRVETEQFKNYDEALAAERKAIVYDFDWYSNTAAPLALIKNGSTPSARKKRRAKLAAQKLQNAQKRQQRTADPIFQKKQRANLKRWRAKNPGYMSAYMRNWHSKNPGYNLKHPARVRRRVS